MKLFCFFFVIFSSFNLISQNNDVHDLIVSAMKKDSLGNTTEALLEIERAIELSGHKNDTALLFHGKLKVDKNDVKSAQKDIKEVLKHNQQYADAYYLRATLKAKTDNYEGAIKDFTKTIVLQPKNYKAYYNRGLSHAYMNEIKQAIADFSKAIELNPNYSIAYFNRGYWKDLMGEPDDAVQDLKKAKQLDPGNKEAYLELAVIYAKNNKMTEACSELEQAASLGHTISEDLKSQFCK
jgi:tetratricopeptide (TPR) repeat protein